MQRAARQLFHQVAGLVKAASRVRSGARTQRDETLGRELRAIQVAARQRGAAQEQLALFAGGDQRAVFAQDGQLDVGQRNADRRQCRPRRGRSGQLVRGDDVRLGRAIVVEQPRFG